MATMNGHEMFPEVGNEKRTISTTIQMRETIAIGRDHRPTLQTCFVLHSLVVMPR